MATVATAPPGADAPILSGSTALPRDTACIARRTMPMQSPIGMSRRTSTLPTTSVGRGWISAMAGC
jgi:hypothetical protein